MMHHDKTSPQPVDASCFKGAEQAPLDYPGQRPDYSFLFHSGNVLYLAAGQEGLNVWDGAAFAAIDAYLERNGGAPLAKRFAVLAVGSNACPGRLLEKFGPGDTAGIPVVRAACQGLVSLYMPRITDYGALPATVSIHPGSKTWLWITFLEKKQMTIMNASERMGQTYDLIQVPDPVWLEDKIRVVPVYGYRAADLLAIGGKSIALAAFPADGGRGHAAMDEKRVLTLVLDELGVLKGRPIEDRNLMLRRDHRLRAEINRRLAAAYTIPNTGLGKPIADPVKLSKARFLQIQTI